MTTLTLPPLPKEYEPTRATLHAYAGAVGAVPRAFAVPHPHWWHISLKVRPEGLVTDPIPLPDGGSLSIRMDLRSHEIVIRAADGSVDTIDMTAGLTATEVGDRIAAVAAEHGLNGGIDRERYANGEAHEYNPIAAEAYFDAFVAVASIFEQHRSTLGLQVGPVQVWPHGFDLAFDWIGTRTERFDGKDLPAQLNLGFYPGGDPYFYSNPWPFEEPLMETPLPHGAVWHTEGWQGTKLPYAALVGDPKAETKLLEYARAVFETASPSLTEYT